MVRRQTKRLSALEVARAKASGMYPDGDGLYLRIADDGGRAWQFRYVLKGRQRYMGLGPVSRVTLAEARQRRDEARQLVSKGIDPIEHARAAASAQALAKAALVTFKESAESLIKAKEVGWRNEKHAAQWRTTLEVYAYPIIGELPVQDVAVGHIMKILEPIWETKTETATRVRGRIEAVLDAAAARGHRTGDNPARWRGHLQSLLPARNKVAAVQHHPALPYGEAGAFMAELRAEEGSSALALELLILTATRTTEAIGARLSEIHLDSKTWIIPPARIKAEREHRIPLSAPAVSVIRRAMKAREQYLKSTKLTEEQAGDFLFPGKPGTHLSNNALLALLERMGRDDLTAHGFRSTFRDWAAEQTNFPREVAEMALAHVIEDKTEAAYRRGDLFEKRRKMMDAWAGYCAKPLAKSGNVVTLHKDVFK